MTTLKYGQVWYVMYSLEDLERLGLIRNPNMWIGDGWRFCLNCRQYAYVFAMSFPGQSNCVEVCKDCETHACNANHPIVNPAYTEYVRTYPLNDPRD